MSTDLGVAVAGGGYWGANLVRNLSQADGWDLRWVCDIDEDRARRAVGRRSSVRMTTSFEDVLGDGEVCAVVIATPAESHARLALTALASGRHVLVEKPLATTLADGEAMVTSARERELTLMCDHTYCYTPAVGRIRALVRDGHIGRVHYVDSVRINLGLVQPDVDVFWDLAPHDLSILDFVLPDDTVPTGVAAHGADPIGAGRACVGYLTLPLSNGGIAHAHVNWLSPTKTRRTTIGGSERMIVWDDLYPSERLRVYDKSVRSDAIAATRADHEPDDEHDGGRLRQARIAYRMGDMVAPALPEREALASAVEEFRRSIVERRPPLTDGEAGLRILRVLEAATASLCDGGRLVSLGCHR